MRTLVSLTEKCNGLSGASPNELPFAGSCGWLGGWEFSGTTIASVFGAAILRCASSRCMTSFLRVTLSALGTRESPCAASLYDARPNRHAGKTNRPSARHFRPRRRSEASTDGYTVFIVTVLGAAASESVLLNHRLAVTGAPALRYKSSAVVSFRHSKIENKRLREFVPVTTPIVPTHFQTLLENAGAIT